MWSSSHESCSRNASSLAVIIRRARMSRPSAAIWSRRKWTHYFESRNRRLYFLLVSCFWWQHRKNKASKASMVSEFLSGRCFICYTSTQISRVTQDTMLWKIKLSLPSKCIPVGHYPVLYIQNIKEPQRLSRQRNVKCFPKESPKSTNSWKPVCLLLKVKTFGQ